MTNSRGWLAASLPKVARNLFCPASGRICAWITADIIMAIAAALALKHLSEPLPS
jgi:hypothetical protein